MITNIHIYLIFVINLELFQREDLEWNQVNFQRMTITIKDRPAFLLSNLFRIYTIKKNQLQPCKDYNFNFKIIEVCVFIKILQNIKNYK